MRSDNSFLLMKHRNRYDLPKGHVDSGETEMQTALRGFIFLSLVKNGFLTFLQSLMKRQEFWMKIFLLIQHFALKKYGLITLK